MKKSWFQHTQLTTEQADELEEDPLGEPQISCMD